MNAALQDLALQAGVPLDTLQQALQWQVTLWSGEISEQERYALQQWRDKSQAHERAWQQVQRITGRLGNVTSVESGHTLRTARRTMSRRQAIKTLSILLGGSAAAYTAQQSGLVQRQFADLHTAIGETREVTLADGTQLHLNTRTAVNIQFDQQVRQIALLEGEVYINTPAQALTQQPPLIVKTRDGLVQARATRFGVHQGESFTQVAVEAGAMDIITSGQASNAITLSQGQQAQFASGRAYNVGPVNPLANAWIRGLLVAERQSLGGFLHQLSRYRPGILRCDEQSARMIVSGSYPLANTERILTALEHALPIRVTRLTPYWVSVSALA